MGRHSRWIRHRPAALAGLATFALMVACSRPDEAATVEDPAVAAVRAELIQMGRADQEVREELDVASATDTARLARMLATDSVNTARLREIVRVHGWPGKSTYGAEAANAAFLIVQHSPSLDFMKEMLELMEPAAESGEADRSDVAMLTDRVLTSDGKPQIYGTQFRIQDGRLVAYPLADTAGLDARRAAMDLGPMSEYVRILGATYKGPVEFDTLRANMPSDTTRL